MQYGSRANAMKQSSVCAVLLNSAWGAGLVLTVRNLSVNCRAEIILILLGIIPQPANAGGSVKPRVKRGAKPWVNR